MLLVDLSMTTAGLVCFYTTSRSGLLMFLFSRGKWGRGHLPADSSEISGCSDTSESTLRVALALALCIIAIRALFTSRCPALALPFFRNRPGMRKVDHNVAMASLSQFVRN
jgi:hypothetical protein